MRVYVAGPITQGDSATNLRRAVYIADRLRDLGHAPYVPHLCGQWELMHPHAYEDWMELGMVWLRQCEALYRIPGKSPGADREVALALTLGIIIWDDLDAVPRAEAPASERAGLMGNAAVFPVPGPAKPRGPRSTETLGAECAGLARRMAALELDSRGLAKGAVEQGFRSDALQRSVDRVGERTEDLEGALRGFDERVGGVADTFALEQQALDQRVSALEERADSMVDDFTARLRALEARGCCSAPAAPAAPEIPADLVEEVSESLREGPPEVVGQCSTAWCVYPATVGPLCDDCAKRPPQALAPEVV